MQNKPEKTRRKTRAVAVFIIMSAIIFAWWSGADYSFSKKEKNPAPGPFSVFKEAIAGSIETLKGEIKK